MPPVPPVPRGDGALERVGFAEHALLAVAVQATDGARWLISRWDENMMMYIGQFHQAKDRNMMIFYGIQMD